MHRLCETGRFSFPYRVAPLFARRHESIRFDVIEAPEYFADAAARDSELVPNIPLVVKLHTPSYLLWRTTFGHSRWVMARNYFASVRRGELPPWNPNHGLERTITLAADEVAAPCQAIADEVVQAWDLERWAQPLFPMCTSLPSRYSTSTRTQTPKLLHSSAGWRVRKGVITLASAIPLVLRDNPKLKIPFRRPIGRASQRR